ncbi:MAG: DUF92 domain-containing protein [Candidatus Korobacteraceae bacterium]|jgi:uncharacterized protein (TIGR00297 family)
MMATIETTTLLAAAALPFWLFTRHMPLLPALGFTTAFALAAWGLRAVTLSGALAGLALSTIICLAAGPPGFIAILTLFLLTFLATRFGYGRKLRQGTAELAHGRNGLQVLANLAVASMTVFPLLFWHSLSWVLLVGFTAALAEEAADTVSSEIGQALSPRRTFLITTHERVDAGRDGAISFAGSLAGLIASGLMAAVCLWFDLLVPRWYWMATLSGVAGMMLDSLLGATLERPGKLGNNSVNFVSTAFSAFLAILIAFLSR